jgi:hypothetical protein
MRFLRVVPMPGARSRHHGRYSRKGFPPLVVQLQIAVKPRHRFTMERPILSENLNHAEAMFRYFASFFFK